jgi:hypothetical protein
MSTPEEVLRRSGQNPLVAWFDEDPAGWKPYFYTAFTDLGVQINAQNVMIIPTMFAPYIWTATTTTIVGNIDDPQTSGLFNDGQYLVSMAEQRMNYMNQPLPALIAFGPHKEGEFADMPLPVFFPAEHTVRFELTNIYTRVLTPTATTFRVYFALKGMSYYGELKPPEDLLRYSRGMI